MQEEIEKAKTTAFRLLSYRIRSCKELTDKLKEKGFSKNTVSAVIRGLKRINYLNDLDFARAFVESRLIYNPRGKTFLRYELLKKGVGESVIDKVLKEKISAEQEEDTARTLAEKIWHRKNKIEINKRTAQTYGYLSRRGFAHSLIKKILKEME